MFSSLLGGEGHAIDVHVVSHCICEGGEEVIEASHGQHIAISRPNLGSTKILPSVIITTFLTLPLHLHENLKQIIDSHISLLVKVLEDDVKAVAALRGEFVKSFQTEPDFTWN